MPTPTEQTYTDPSNEPEGDAGTDTGEADADDPRLEQGRELERPDTIPAHLQDEPEDELKQRIVENVCEIYDPEIPVNVYDLGLVFNIDVHDDNHVDVLMTLTAPNCPAAGILPGQVEDAVRMTEGVKSVYLELTFDPPFSPEMMSEEAQLELGFM